MDHPAEFEKLKRTPDLVETGADEIVRWTTPVNHFSRTAMVDYELRGQHIKKGDSVALFYASANRDEEIFPGPLRVPPRPRSQPAPGLRVGEHFCLGAHLARLDLKVFFRSSRSVWSRSSSPRRYSGCTPVSSAGRSTCRYVTVSSPRDRRAGVGAGRRRARPA